MSHKGVKISFEGIDGSGKSTQIGLVSGALGELGYKVFVAPDNSDASEENIDGEILGILRKGKDRFFRVGSPTTEALLLAARASYLDETEIKPKLDNGHIVLCDRDIDTFVVYGLPSLQSKYPNKTVRELSEWLFSLVSIGRTPPDLTLLFEPNLKQFLSRATVGPKRDKRLEKFNDADKSFLQSAANHYEHLAKDFGERIQTLDVSNKTPREVTRDILAVIEPFLREKHVPKF